MSDVTRIAGQAQTFPYYLRDAQNQLVTPLSAPQQSIHASSADAATGANPLSGPTALTGSAGSYTATYPVGLAAGTYYLRTVTALTGSTTLTDVDDRLILQTVTGSVTSALATLDEFKAHINWKSTSTTTEAELQDFLNAATPVVEHITGPVLPRQVTELHSGGTAFLVLRERPVMDVIGITEYAGSVARVLTFAASPAAATANSYTLDLPTATVVRRAAGGSSITFPDGDLNVTVVYDAGYASVPYNVKKAALEQAGHMFRQTQLGGRPSLQAAVAGGGVSTGYGFGVPNAVEEYLNANRRLPGIA